MSEPSNLGNQKIILLFLDGPESDLALDSSEEYSQAINKTNTKVNSTAIFFDFFSLLSLLY